MIPTDTLRRALASLTGDQPEDLGHRFAHHLLVLDDDGVDVLALDPFPMKRTPEEHELHRGPRPNTKHLELNHDYIQDPGAAPVNSGF